jgi:hypothetical protein
MAGKKKVGGDEVEVRLCPDICHSKTITDTYCGRGKQDSVIMCTAL